MSEWVYQIWKSWSYLWRLSMADSNSRGLAGGEVSTALRDSKNSYCSSVI